MTINKWNSHTWLAIDNLYIVDPSNGEIITAYELKTDFDSRPCQLFPALRRALYYDWRSKPEDKRPCINVLEKSMGMLLKESLYTRYMNTQDINLKTSTDNYSDDFDDMARVQTRNDLNYEIEWFDANRLCHKHYGNPIFHSYTSKTLTKLMWHEGKFLEVFYLRDREAFQIDHYFESDTESNQTTVFSTDGNEDNEEEDDSDDDSQDEDNSIASLPPQQQPPIFMHGRNGSLQDPKGRAFDFGHG